MIAKWKTNNKKIPWIHFCKKIHYRGIVTIAYIYKAISEILLYRDLLHEWTLFARTKTSGTAGNSSKNCGNEPIGKIFVVSNKSHNNSHIGITRRVDTSRHFLFGLRERRDQIWSCLALVWHFSLDQKVMQNVIYIRARSRNPSSSKIWILLLHNFIWASLLRIYVSR